MEWMNSNLKEIEPTNISNQEQKEKIAKEIAQKVKDGDVIGFGSGSTSYLAIKEIAKRIGRRGIAYYCNPYFLWNKSIMP